MQHGLARLCQPGTNGDKPHCTILRLGRQTLSRQSIGCGSQVVLTTDTALATGIGAGGLSLGLDARRLPVSSICLATSARSSLMRVCLAVAIAIAAARTLPRS